MGMRIIIIVGLLAIPIGIWMLFLREKSNWFKICSILLIVLGAISSSITAYLSFAKNPSLQNIGVLTPKYQRSYKQETAGIAIRGDTSNQIYTIQMKENVIVQPFGRMVPFSLERTEKGLLISMVIQSSDGKITAKMIRNKWVINPNNRFRTNFDAHALEIIDDYDIPVLQIEYLDAVTVKIGGVFFPESENISSISIYHDFPSVPDNVGEVALFSMGSHVIILGKGAMISKGKPNTPSEKEEIRTIAKRYIEPWFDYTDPEKIGIRKTVESITISKKDRKKYSNLSRGKMKDTVKIFVHDLREFTTKSNEELFNATKTVQGDEWLRKITEWSKKPLMEYNRRFKIESIILRDELLSRLPKNFVHDFQYNSYENPVNLTDCEKVADDLEKLASNL
jgi:hypothetical protein